MTIESINFESSWNETTIHLAPPELTTCGRITQIALDIFSILFPPLGIARIISYAVDDFANRVALPAAHNMSKDRLEHALKNFYDYWEGPIQECNQLVRENYSLVEQTVITPDKNALKAYCIQYKHCTPATPTIIFFNGNFQLCAETPMWFLEESIKVYPSNFVIFDYRGVGQSEGVFTGPRDLVVDGASIVDWVRQKIHTDPSLIYFYGFSLGGAVACLTKALDPEHLTGKLVSDRSFSSSDKVLASRYGTGFFGRLLNFLFYANGYSADVSSSFERLSGEKMVIYHPDDAVIPFDAGMHCQQLHNEVICLQPKEEFEEKSKEHNHIAPLYWHESAIERVLAFLFPVESIQSTI